MEASEIVGLVIAWLLCMGLLVPLVEDGRIPIPVLFLVVLGGPVTMLLAVCACILAVGLYAVAYPFMALWRVSIPERKLYVSEDEARQAAVGTLTAQRARIDAQLVELGAVPSVEAPPPVSDAKVEALRAAISEAGAYLIEKRYDEAYRVLHDAYHAPAARAVSGEDKG